MPPNALAHPAIPGWAAVLLFLSEKALHSTTPSPLGVGPAGPQVCHLDPEVEAELSRASTCTCPETTSWGSESAEEQTAWITSAVLTIGGVVANLLVNIFGARRRYNVAPPRRGGGILD